MLKVHILDYCPHCNGQGYLPLGEVVDHLGRKYTRYAPCTQCSGGGTLGKWVSLEEFARLLQQELCKHEHTTTIGSMRFTAGDVLDDIREVCIDCGANLEQQTLGALLQDED
jgi:hypothetical protein